MADSPEPRWPLSPLDDHLVHQIPAPVRMVATSDPRAYDRYWTVGHNAAAKVIFTIGGSVYPNLDLAEAYALVNHDGHHVSVRMSRPLGSDRSDMHVGPLQAEVVKPLAEWRYRLDAPEFGLRFDIRWFDAVRPRYRPPEDGRTGRGYPRGRPGEPTAGFESFGEFEGWIDVAGTLLKLTRADTRGTRDRHWGTREGVGGPELLLGARPPIGGNGYQFVFFGDWGIWADQIVYANATKDEEIRVRKVDRKVRFDDAHQFLEGILESSLTDGTKKVVHYKRVGYLSTYLRCGFYGGPDGGAPGSGRWQGQLPALEVPEGEAVDTRTANRRAMLSGLNEHLCVATCEGQRAEGLIQTYDSVAFELCTKNRPGWSFL